MKINDVVTIYERFTRDGDLQPMGKARIRKIVNRANSTAIVTFIDDEYQIRQEKVIYEDQSV